LSETQDDLRTTAQSIAADAEQLKQVEEAKTELAADDPRLSVLTAKAERIIDEISSKGELQSALAEELQPEG
jgi:ERCC4-type nuclease